MKKLIVLSVVFALVATAAFAVDLGGTVFGHIDVLKGDTAKDANGDATKITSGGNMDRLRIDGYGEVEDGKFGGYLRLDSGDVATAYAFWKPIDQFKLIIGWNGDSFWGKEGVTGWGFNQMPYDAGIAFNPGIWCGEGWGSDEYTGGSAPPYFHNRYVFFEGFQDQGFGLEIKPLDMLSINIGLPFITAPRGEETADQFKAAIAQINLNLAFGNIAITYDGANRAGIAGGDGGAIFIYYGGVFGDLGLDVGFSYHLAGAADTEKPQWGTNDKAQPIGVGLGVKYATDSFGVKLRLTAALGGDETVDDTTYINASLLPYFNLGDNLTAFVNVGLGMITPKEGDATTCWYFNPYLRVGAEWGPTFYIGVKVFSDGYKGPTGDDDAIIKWSVPIALQVSF